MPNPWTLLAGIVTAIALAVGAFFYGEHVDNLSWTAAIEKQHAEAAATLAQATAKAAALQHQLDALNTQIEADHADHQAKITAAAADNQRLADQLNRLLQSRGGAGGDGALSGPAATAAGGGELSAAYRELSGVLGDVLTRGNRLALDADREAAAATECHDWAVRAFMEQH